MTSASTSTSTSASAPAGALELRWASPAASAAVDRAALRSVAAGLVELGSMPRARRGQRFQTLAPELWMLTALLSGPAADEAMIARRVVDEDGFARSLAEALLGLLTDL